MPGVLTRAAGDLATPRQRLAAWADLMLVDHGVFRAIYLNRHEVAPGIWRSAQPSPGDLQRLADQGLKTVLNLRGVRRCSSYLLEVDACQRFGLTLIDLPIGSREGPPLDRIERAAEVFTRAERPLLMHCKSGADRAGMMAALYLLIHERRPVAEAAKQLSLRFGHVQAARTGVLDAVLAAFAASGTADFLAWARTAYDPDAIKAAFLATGAAQRWSSHLVDRVLRRE